MHSNSTPHSWRHKRARKALLDWYSDKQQVISLKNTLLESSSQKTRNPIFPCPWSRASSSQVQLNLDNRLLDNWNSPLIRTKSDFLGFTSYIYCKFNLENPKPRSQQCFVAPFLCISPMIPVTASDFMLCLSEIQSPNTLHASIFRQVCGALLRFFIHWLFLILLDNTAIRLRFVRAGTNIVLETSPTQLTLRAVKAQSSRGHVH